MLALNRSPRNRHFVKLYRCSGAWFLQRGFYEWQKRNDEKLPYFIHLKDHEVFGFAGLYDIWHDKQGTEVKSYTIITTAPNSLIASIHDRMPVILRKEDEAFWLNPDVIEPEQLQGVLHPYPEEEMQAYIVSNKVNSPANDRQEITMPA